MHSENKARLDASVTSERCRMAADSVIILLYAVAKGIFICKSSPRLRDAGVT